MRPELSPGRVFAVTLVGVLLVQAAWILAVPAYRGSDEFDHVYKIAAVARGEWTSSGPAKNGRGGLVRIPSDIPRTAEPICSSYRYTGPDNCRAAHRYPDGTVDVATAAGAYNPAYYAFVALAVGTFTDGTATLYVARAVTALLCALLLAWACALTARWAKTRWPLVMAAAGLTPVLLYSTSIAAPNGVSYASAALVWSAVVAAHRGVGPPRSLAIPFVVGATGLLCTHTTGILWLGLAAIVALFLRSPASWWRLLRPGLFSWLTAGGIVTIVAGLCAAWVRYANTNALGESPNTGLPSVLDFARFVLLWSLQGVAVFPNRNDPAPTGVYLLWGIPLIAFLVVAFRRARGERKALVVALAVLVAVPVTLTMATYAQEGVAWQGRYSLPMWLSVTWLCGSALDRVRGPGPRMVFPLMVALATAMAWSAVHVAHAETARHILAPVADGVLWYAVVAVLAAAGTALPLLAAGLTSSRAKTTTDTPAHPTAAAAR